MALVKLVSISLVAALALGLGCYEVRPGPYRESAASDDRPGRLADLGPSVIEDPQLPPRRVIERPVLPRVQCDVEPTADCVSSFPRVMIIMDASSSMLAGRSPGANNWDKARFALAGNPDASDPNEAFARPAFERELDVRGNVITMEDVFYLGMIVFNAADTQELLLQYAPCATDNIRWAMDPEVSCDPPGCVDPYVGEPVWTSKNSDFDRDPPFVHPTMSYMPPCNPGGRAECIGNMYNTYTAEGLEFARTNIRDYRRDAGSLELAPDTRFANILITDGDTAPDSPPGEILRRLASEGVPTYVIGLQSGGFGLDVASTLEQLDRYAVAGGTELATLVPANDADIADAFAATVTRIIDEVGTDPCCQPNDCSEQPEPPDPRN